MSNILGSTSVTLSDLNDAVLSTTPPDVTAEDAGVLWLDSSGERNVLKMWTGSQWTAAEVDVSELDPDLSHTVETIQSTLGTMAEDGVLTHSERITLTEDLARIIGEMPSTSTTIKYQGSLPDYTTLDSNGTGTFARYRASARDVGISTNETLYTDLETTYNELNSYLSSKDPLPWDIRTSREDEGTDLGDSGDQFRQIMLDYYLAELALVKETEKQAREKAEEFSKDMAADTVSVTEGQTPMVAQPTQEGGALHVEMDGKTTHKTPVGDGGRNLAKGTSDNWESASWSSWNVITNQSIYVEPSQYYTISVDYKDVDTPNNVGVGLRLFWYDKDGTRDESRDSDNIADGEEGRINFTLKAPSNAYTVDIVLRQQEPTSGGSAKYRNLKLEKGTVATDWTPAPEDVQDNLQSIGNQKIVSQLASINGDPQTEVSSMEFDGRNLIPSNIVSENQVTIHESKGTKYYDFTTNGTYGGLRINAKDLDLLPDTEYVFSYKYKKTKGTLVSFGGHTDGVFTNNIPYIDGNKKNSYRSSDSVFVSDDTDVHFVKVYIKTNDDVDSYSWIYIQPNRGEDVPVRVAVYDIQLEKGTATTDWTPAPENAPYDELYHKIYKTKLEGIEPLRGVGDVHDRLFRDTDRLWKVERNLAEHTPSEITSIKESMSDTTSFILNYLDSDKAFNTYIDQAVSSHFVYDRGRYAVNDYIGMTTWGGPSESQTAIMINLPNSLATTVAEAQSWLDNLESPLKFIYSLETPYIETLPNKLQDKLNSIPSFKDQTSVYFIKEDDGTYKGGVPVDTNVRVHAKSNSWFRQQQNKDYTDESSSNQGSALDTTGVNTGYQIPQLQMDPLSEYSIEALVYWNGSTSTTGVFARPDPDMSLDFIHYEQTTELPERAHIKFRNTYDSTTAEVNTDTNGQDYLDMTGIEPRKWYRVSVTADSSTSRIYVDGALQASTSTSQPFIVEDLILGESSNGNPFAGYISDFRLWSKQLTENEINQNMTKQLTGLEPNLLLNYKLNGGNLIYDSSPNQNHIQLEEGDATWINQTSALRDFQDNVSSEIDDKVGESEERTIETVNAVSENLGSELRDTVSTLETDFQGQLEDLESSVISQTSDNFSVQFNTLKNDLDTTSNELTELQSYFNFSQSGEFSIGSGNSPYRMVLSNDRLSFMDGTTEVAYISNSTMQITSGVFVEDLTIGEHKIQTVEGGMTTFRWAPN